MSLDSQSLASHRNHMVSCGGRKNLEKQLPIEYFLFSTEHWTVHVTHRVTNETF